MQVELLRNIVTKMVGQQASAIVNLLYGKNDVNEFLIAKKMKMTVNQVRNILYRLADEGLVSFNRKKDRKKGGWYVYFWTLNSGKGLIRFKEHLEKELDNLRGKLGQKRTQRFYHCPSCGVEINEESALLCNYTCSECGEVMQLKEKGKEVEMLEKEIARHESILNSVNKEIGEIEKIEETKKRRKLMFQERKKMRERAARKKAKERELAKLKRLKEKKRKKKISKKNQTKDSGISWKKKLGKLFS
ncbi:MAG: hypothetical protein N3D20_02235 [Candidatus Pacearchaeota archaeon]|nr:hypothetical protein [Candidatus Pacearchaeota archaeon]